MSRVGKKPITVPAGVQVKVDGTTVHVKGPKGELTRTFAPEIGIELNGQVLNLTRVSDARQVRALHGTTRAVLSNMITGVSTGFQKVLHVEGVGYRAEMKGKQLSLALGFSHPVIIDPPVGITFSSDDKTKTITISGYDKEQVGQVAANVRGWRPPEPYKGKGLRYAGEVVRRKAGKAGKV